MDLYCNPKADHVCNDTGKKKKKEGERTTGGKNVQRHKNISDKKS